MFIPSATLQYLTEAQCFDLTVYNASPFGLSELFDPDETEVFEQAGSSDPQTVLRTFNYLQSSWVHAIATGETVTQGSLSLRTHLLTSDWSQTPAVNHTGLMFEETGTDLDITLHKRDTGKLVRSLGLFSRVTDRGKIGEVIVNGALATSIRLDDTDHNGLVEFFKQFQEMNQSSKNLLADGVMALNTQYKTHEEFLATVAALVKKAHPTKKQIASALIHFGTVTKNRPFMHFGPKDKLFVLRREYIKLWEDIARRICTVTSDKAQALGELSYLQSFDDKLAMNEEFVAARRVIEEWHHNML